MTDIGSLRPTCQELRERGVSISLKTLPKMLLAPNGPFCMELAKDGRPPQYDSSHSWRYTIMCLLGMVRAEQAGVSTGVDIKGIFDHAVRVSSQFRTGDIGLLLWLAMRLQLDEATRISEDLKTRIRSCELDTLEGMEVAWLLTGLSSAIKIGDNASLAGRILSYFLERRIGKSGLIRHYGAGLRSRFPNFATQIYSVHALSICARFIDEKRIKPNATKLVERLISAQRKNGGWPWLYDEVTGSVVEAFEVYSVHQHAMAPMALLEYIETFGHNVSDPIMKGLTWLDSKNELNYPMIDEQTGLIYRSVRRRWPGSKLVPYSRAAKCALGLKLHEHSDPPSGLELNATCRPYELGWLLEAWCGRNSVANFINTATR